MYKKKVNLILGIFFLIFLFTITFVSAGEFGFNKYSTPTTNLYLYNNSELYHNNLSEIQGGIAGEYYHIRESWFNELTSDIFDWITQAEGDVRYLQSYTETDPFWSGNQTNYFNKTDILGFNYYNSSDFSINNYRTLSNLTFLGGNVGIGTTAPTSLLHVDATGKATTGNPTFEVITSAGEAATYGSEIRTLSGNRAALLVENSAASGSGRGLVVNSATATGLILDVQDGGSSVFVVEDGGNVGIGTTGPVYPLHINSGETNGAALLESTDGTATLYIRDDSTTGNTYVGVSAVGDELRLRSGNTENLVIDNNGNVGIGTASPSYPLEINGQNSGISLYTSHNISATGFITRTQLYDKSKNVWDYLKDADYYKNEDNKVDHSKYYGFVSNITSTDYSKPIIENYTEEVCDQIEVNKTIQECSWISELIFNCEEIIETTTEIQCNNITKQRTTYPYVKVEDGVNLESEINLLRQAIFELKQELEALKYI